MKSTAITVYLVAVLGTVTAWTNFLNFDTCDTYQIHKVNTDLSYQISWDGYKLSSYQRSCKIGFHAYDSDAPLNEYKLCIRATSWYIQDTQVKLKYYTGFEDELAETYSYYSGSFDDPTNEWCSDSGDYVDIELTTSDSDGSQGSITLEVRGVITYDYNKIIGWSVGGAVGGVFLISLCITITIVVACRRRRTPTGGITYGTPTTTGTIITQSGSQQMGGYSNQGYVTGPAPPPYYEATKGTYPVAAQPNYQGNTSYQQYSDTGSTQQTTLITQTTQQEQTS